MLIVMRQDATAEQIQAVVEKIKELGFKPHAIPGSERTAIGITGNHGPVEPDLFELLPGVAQAIPVSQPFKLVSSEVKPERTVVNVNGATIGGESLAVMAGPCSVESESQLMACARAAKAAGAQFLRGGAFKPRTSPYDFQGLKEDGLKLLALAREETGLKVVTEVMSPGTVDMVARYADVLQIGARNMQNFPLLEEVGDAKRPVLLKRGLSATIKELLMAAEYIASRGNYEIVLCERGIRTFETMTRNTLDLGAVIVLKQLSHLPVIVDPSHGFGLRYGVIPLARAGVAVGADGLIVEIHPEPEHALSDGPQSLTLPMFQELMRQIRLVASSIGRRI
ncbi:MAG TPA: 3-deoxy-7-phosphoheptulonate synthase [Nitrospiria bacterium]|jgi:3-deoxy-7-phosphoheptulonate synthase|nr:3-deoxy-7-phosphoheptulonate synthase [Nitrospiria bacterium]